MISAMTRFSRRVAFVAVMMAAAAGAAGGAAVQEARLAALGGIRPGTWQLHEIGKPGSMREICVHDPRLLLQLMHGAADCPSYVIEDKADRATVQYRCTGLGYGRTTIKVEDSSLIRLQTQGLAKGAPFDFDYEGRRTGGC